MIHKLVGRVSRARITEIIISAQVIDWRLYLADTSYDDTMQVQEETWDSRWVVNQSINLAFKPLFVWLERSLELWQ